MGLGVGELRKLLHEACLRFASLRDLESAVALESIAEQFGIAKRRARVRRDKWKERTANRGGEDREEDVGDGLSICRVEGCKNPPVYRPVILFSPENGGEPITVETAMLDVCEWHARNLGTEVYTDNPSIWGAIVQTWTKNGLPAPDPSALVEVQYHPIPARIAT